MAFLARIAFGRAVQTFVFKIAGEGARGEGGACGGTGEEGGGGETGCGCDGGDGGGRGGVEAAVEDGFELGDAPDFHVEVLGFAYDVVLVARWWHGIFARSTSYVMVRSPRKGWWSEGNEIRGTNLPRGRIGLLRIRDFETFSLFVRLSSSEGRGLLVIKCVISLQKKSSMF